MGWTSARRRSTFVASVLLAMLATYVALDFADRLRGAMERGARCSWILAGSVAMGTGIWAMHFVGMSAARFPLPAARLTAQILAARGPEAGPSAGLHRHAIAQMDGA